MGSVSLKIGDGTARFHRATLCSYVVHLLMLLSVVVTNLFALYAFTSSPHPHSTTTTATSSLADHVSSILRDIESSERTLHQISRDLSGYPSLDPTSPSLPRELRSFLSRQPLPLGRDSRTGITELASSVSHSCLSPSPDLLRQFTSYRPRAPCPSADHPHLPLKLLSLSCDPLPRRRCLSRSSPPPPPQTTHNPSKTSSSKNDFSIDDVLSLSLSPPGAVRIGFDVDAPDADFAAAMAARNVTVVTSSGGWIHRDGLLTLNISPRRRFPFYDNVFDLVRVVKGLDGRDAMEFFMFDVDRVMRPGGLLWLDSYHCVDDERKTAVTRLVGKFGYKKLKWVVGEKAGSGKGRVYLSAVLRKPVRG